MIIVSDIKNKKLHRHITYSVKDESRKRRINCELIQQTEFLFIFKPIKIKNELDKRVICISKTNWFLNRSLVYQT